MQFRFIILTGISLALCTSSFARDYVSMKGSSTVFPFATIVAEQLGKNPSIKTPVVESGGSSVGKKGVCEGTGTQFVDIGNVPSLVSIEIKMSPEGVTWLPFISVVNSRTNGEPIEVCGLTDS